VCGSDQLVCPVPLGTTAPHPSLSVCDFIGTSFSLFYEKNKKQKQKQKKHIVLSCIGTSVAVAVSTSPRK
jgi:hypothetical protein